MWGWAEGGTDGERTEGGREEGKEGRREGGRKGGKEGKRGEGREGGRKGKKKGGMKVSTTLE